MAEKTLVNMLRQAATTGLSQTTSNVLAASGQSMEFYEFASADAARFYLDISAAGTSIQFDLWERDPATGVFFKNNPAGDPLFGVAFTSTQAGLATTVDPCYGEAYQVKWTVTGSFTCSLLALALRRGRR